jgi:hypothetical protein
MATQLGPVGCWAVINSVNQHGTNALDVLRKCQRASAFDQAVLCRSCGISYHPQCMPVKCVCKEDKLIFIPNNKCIMSHCQLKETVQGLFCRRCVDVLHQKLQQMIDFSGTKGLLEEELLNKMFSVFGLEIYQHVHKMLAPAVLDVVKKHERLMVVRVADNTSRYYSRCHYIVKAMLSSAHTVFDRECITSMDEYRAAAGTVGPDDFWRTFRVFLRQLCALDNAALVWLPNNMIRERTLLNVYDKDSMLQRIEQHSTRGIRLQDLYAEYDNAYHDVHMLQTDQKVWIDGRWEHVFPISIATAPIPNLREAWTTYAETLRSGAHSAVCEAST